jgi:hypothetical protein
MKVALAVAAGSVTASPLPANVQHAISNNVPADVRYVPTEVPTGYRYAKWDRRSSSLEIYFARKGRSPTLAFLAGASGPPGACTAGGTHTYRLGSARVSSRGTGTTSSSGAAFAPVPSTFKQRYDARTR